MNRLDNNISSENTPSNNSKEKNNLISRIKKLSNKATIIITICCIIIGGLLIAFGAYIGKQAESWVETFLLTLGSTFISVVIINIAYQHWQDSKSESNMASIVRDIPNNVIKGIETHIDIGKQNLNQLRPGIPENIIKPGKSKEDPVVKGLIESLGPNNKHYYYVGIGMTTMAQAIVQLERSQLEYAYFLIPNPTLGIVTSVYMNKMKESIEAMLKVWEDPNRTLCLEFVFLKDLPLFHIHKTETDCWFAFVDQDGKERYPVTYQYKKDTNIDNDGLEMYHTIADMINKLYAKNKTKSCYIFDFEKKIKNGKKDITKEKFIALFDKKIKVNKHESRS